MAKKTRGLDGLLLTPFQEQVAKGNKAVGFLRLSPEHFLFLTTRHPQDAAAIRAEARPLEQYNAWSQDGNILNSPFLRIDRSTGQVCGHEGRHRAAALEKTEPGEALDVAIVLKDRGCGTTRYYEERSKPGGEIYQRQKRYLGKGDVPRRFCNEYDEQRCVRVDLGTWRGLYAEEETRWPAEGQLKGHGTLKGMAKTKTKVKKTVSWHRSGKRDQQYSESGSCTAVIGRTLDKKRVLWTVTGAKPASGFTQKKATAKQKAAAALRRCSAARSR